MSFSTMIKAILPAEWSNYLRLFRYWLSSEKKIYAVEKELTDKHAKQTGLIMDWNNPATYTEKVIFTKLYDASTFKAKLTDKASARDWVGSQIGEEYLVPIYGVYNDFDDIEFDKLPNQFVIKCTHDSGSVNVIQDKKKIDFKALRKAYSFYMKRNYAYMSYEMHYKDIPHRIIIEKYMGESISDYKFLCFGGRVYYCWVDVDRFTNHKRNVYDMEWNLQPFNQYTYGNSNKEIPKPKQFDEMVRIVNKLCKGFEHVRVDLYLIDEKIYFGEMTFTNGSGNEIITPQEWDYKLGDLWKIDVSKRSKHKIIEKMCDFIIDEDKTVD